MQRCKYHKRESPFHFSFQVMQIHYISFHAKIVFQTEGCRFLPFTPRIVKGNVSTTHITFTFKIADTLMLSSSKLQQGLVFHIGECRSR